MLYYREVRNLKSAISDEHHDGRSTGVFAPMLSPGQIRLQMLAAEISSISTVILIGRRPKADTGPTGWGH